MAHENLSSDIIVADLTAACTLTANADFTNSGGIVVAGVGGVVAGILPDTILAVTGAADMVLTLPKIGTQACPVGSTVAIRKTDAAGAGKVTITAHPSAGATDAGDLINGAASDSASALIASNANSTLVRACSIAAPVAPALNGVGQWRTVLSSLPNV